MRRAKTAGFLALLSTSEVSAFIICLITLDHLLMINFPLRYGLHLTPNIATMAWGAAWVLGVAIAAVPLLPFAALWVVLQSDRHLSSAAHHAPPVSRPALLFCCLHRPQLRPLPADRRRTAVHLPGPPRHAHGGQEQASSAGHEGRPQSISPRHHRLLLLVSCGRHGTVGGPGQAHPRRGQRDDRHLQAAAKLGAQTFPVHVQHGTGETQKDDGRAANPGRGGWGVGVTPG